MMVFDPELHKARRGWKPLTLVLLVSAWLALVGNLALWRTIWALPELNGWRGMVFSLALAAWIGSALVVLLSLLAWPRLFKPLAVLLLLVAASSSYFMLQYGVVIDATMMANVANTDPREVRDLLSWPLLGSLLFVAVLPGAWLLRQRIVWRPWWAQAWRNLAVSVLALGVLGGVTLASYQDLASLMRNHKHVRYLFNPLNVLYGGGKLAADAVPRARQTLQPIGLDARLGPTHASAQRTPLVVLVVGETARAANFSLGGYPRPTNPQLAQLQTEGGLTYFTDVRSCGTNTQASVPCMFSHQGKEAHEASRQPHENLLDVLQRAGLAVLWLDNQSGCKGLCERVSQVLTRTLEDPALCSGGECFDEIMLKDLDQRIAALDPVRRARGVVVVMHQMGSHGPAYYRRSPPAFKKFMPECASNVLQDCPREQLVNTYDNSILYTDHLLASTVRWLQRSAQQRPLDTAMVYVSDHGESLGENNLYLHGLPYALAPRFQIHVPMVTWLSPAMQTRLGLRDGCLQKTAATPLTHDNLFHSMLGLLDVNTTLHQARLDIFSACR
jgi:lipid A ethanolaminephosphotransferase